MTGRLNDRAGRRTSRRVLLRSAAAGSGLAAATLIACGGGERRTESGGSGASVADTRPALDSAQGKPGGTFKFMLAGFPLNFTVTENSTSYNTVGYVHSALLAQAWGQESVKPDAFTSLEPNLAQALPEQPDELTTIYTLRPDVRFHTGRPLTAEDVAYSFDRYKNFERSAFRTQWRAWLDRVDTPDRQTVVVRTRFPYADHLFEAAGHRGGFVFAKEHEESPAAAQKRVGSGPFIDVEAQPPIVQKYRRNPDYHRRPFPYVDEIHSFGTLDPVRKVVDFVTRQIHSPWVVYADQRDEITGQRPDAKVQGNDAYAPAIFMRTDKPPFNDKRVRQALSMAIDRKKLREGVNKGEGRPDQFFAVGYKNRLGTREVSELGAAARYWEYNPAEAKKLLAAAGITEPLELEMVHWPAGTLGQWFVDMATLIQAQWREQRIANTKDVEQALTVWASTTGQGNYESTYFAVGGGFNGPTFALATLDRLGRTPTGDRPVGNLSHINDPRLAQLADKQVRQLNFEERKQTYREMEPILAEEQYIIITNTTTQYWIWDPGLRNVRFAYEVGNRHYMMRWWFA